jgi:hypothetical protein
MYSKKNIAKELYGKEISPSMAVIDLQIKFGLWADSKQWLEPSLQAKHWYDTAALEQSGLALTVKLNSQPILQHQFRQFHTVNLQHVLEDDEPCDCNLQIEFLNFDKVPVRDNTGKSVCGMIEIQSIQFQKIDVTQLLENTFYGENCTIDLSFSCPVYTWLVMQWPKLIPDLQYVVSIDDIEKYNRQNLKFR